MSQAEVAVLITTYQRPQNLRRVLESVRLQRGVEGRMEVIVCDDGSTDETPQVVAEFARQAPFPVAFTTHEHSAFQAARCRNDAVRASHAPHLLFVDGDCIIPPDHVRMHLEHRRPHTVLFGDSCKFDEATSASVTLDTIASGEFPRWAAASEVRRLRKTDRRARLYQFLRHRRKPKLLSNNMSLARADYERGGVNGFDENYRGWGCEDDDLGPAAAHGRHLGRVGAAMDLELSPLATARSERARQVEPGAERGLLSPPGVASPAAATGWSSARSTTCRFTWLVRQTCARGRWAASTLGPD